jgi:hypothetical protein
MKAFYRVQRLNGMLWVKMYATGKGVVYAACRPVLNRKEAKVAFHDFVRDLP